MKIFIDGREGTTGLELEERLSRLPSTELLDIAPEFRKDADARRAMYAKADAVFLCLPDVAAKEAVTMAEDLDVVIIDASTAHRTSPDWAYGFPELSEAHEQAVKTSNRIAVPGCYPTGFCALVYPLRMSGMIGKSEVLTCNALSGYSGGGKTMIARYECVDAPTDARPYGYSLKHKHVPEMTAVCQLDNPPIFQPCVIPVRQGMLVNVPLALNSEKCWDILSNWYKNAENVRVMPYGGESSLDLGALPMCGLAGTDLLELFVFGSETQTLLTARLDNLGKGASGAAVQNLKLRFGL